MIKVMVFIDGSWLYRNTPKLAKRYGRSDYRIDYGKLPNVLCEELAKQMNIQENEIDLIRTNLFASIPVNYHYEDEELVEKQRDFYEILREEYHYETEIYNINFSGAPVRSHDDVCRTIRPEEKCVDVALATSMLYFSAIPNTYDIAVPVIGDRDYIPALKHVRQLGKRVAVASIQGSCAKEYLDFADKEKIKDYDVIFLGNLLNKLEFKYEPRQVRCESEFHIGNRYVWTTYRPRKGRPFYCDDCMAKFTEQRKEALKAAGFTRPVETGYAQPSENFPSNNSLGGTLTGSIKRVLTEKFYGFISGENGQDYYFNKNNLSEELTWEDVQDLGIRVEFEVYREPNDYQAGAAMNVRLAPPEQEMEPYDVENELEPPSSTEESFEADSYEIDEDSQAAYDID